MWLDDFELYQMINGWEAWAKANTSTPGNKGQAYGLLDCAADMRDFIAREQERVSPKTPSPESTRCMIFREAGT